MTFFRVSVPFLQGPWTYTPISSVVGVAGLAILFRSYPGARPKQELLPHLSEPRTAKFAVKHVKYIGHDRTPCLIIAVNTLSTASVRVRDVN
jgi:hypothetical protein